MEVLIEQITLANKNRFGRSSEKMTDTSQICFIEVDGTIVFFNACSPFAVLLYSWSNFLITYCLSSSNFSMKFTINSLNNLNSFVSTIPSLLDLSGKLSFNLDILICPHI